MNSQVDHLNYRRMLQRELEQRRFKNKAYSLRAFAANLDVSAPFLSQVISGKKHLSIDRAHGVMKKVKWPHRQKKLFLNLVQMENSKNTDAKNLSAKHARALSEVDFLDLQHDRFQLVSEWHHFALVELTQIKGFREDAAWISQKVGIPAQMVMPSIERLLRTGLLKRENGKLQKPHTYGIGAIPSQAIQKFHRDHLEKATKALNSQIFQARDFTGQTLAINKKKLAEVKELIWEFQNKISQYYTDETDSDSVYHLAVQFYRLDQDRK